MSARPLAALACCVGLVAAGCGGGGSKDPRVEQFASLGCASCHTLAAADATGRVGPNLDTLRPDATAVERQVTRGGGGMPSFRGRLSPAEIRTLARWVARVAGRR
jgi:mono/diheme cytochrome c family protein